MVRALALLSMPDFCAHSPFFASDFSSSFSCLFCSHCVVSVEFYYLFVIVPDFFGSANGGVQMGARRVCVKN